jgi:hypothetical protein
MAAVHKQLGRIRIEHLTLADLGIGNAKVGMGSSKVFAECSSGYAEHFSDTKPQCGVAAGRRSQNVHRIILRAP